jgi:predicted RNA-binding protein YlxR (DUF448 family)
VKAVARERAERTCVGCRGKANKRDLLRIVRVDEGLVAVDPSGSAPGRGTYVHPDAECVESALEHGAVARALRTGLAAEGAVRLRNDLVRLIGAV